MQPKKEIVQSQLHIERMPEIWNRRAYKGGVRTIVRRNQKLEIGLPGMKVGFSRNERKILLEIIQMWYALGKPTSGHIYKEGSPLSLSKFNDNLYDGEKGERKHRTGGMYRKRLEGWFKNMLMIPWLHSFTGTTKDGKLINEQQSFTLITSAKWMKDKTSRYFDLSDITLHPAIVKSLLAHDMKPVRLDVLRDIRGENDSIVYSEFDLVLSNRHNFYREVISFCKDLGFEYKRERDYVAKMKSSCKKIKGKALSSDGVILKCDVVKGKELNGILKREAVKDDDGYYIYAIKGSVVKEITQTVEPKIEPAIIKEAEEYLKESSRLVEIYSEFSQHEKKRADDLSDQFLKIHPYPFSQNSKNDCFYRAIREVSNQEEIKKKIFNVATEITMREPACRAPYLGKLERETIKKLLCVLTIIARNKGTIKTPLNNLSTTYP